MMTSAPAMISGISSGMGNPSPQAIMGQELFNERFPDAPRLNQAVRVAPDRAAAVREAVGPHRSTDVRFDETQRR